MFQAYIGIFLKHAIDLDTLHALDERHLGKCPDTLIQPCRNSDDDQGMLIKETLATILLIDIVNCC